MRTTFGEIEDDLVSREEDIIIMSQVRKPVKGQLEGRCAGDQGVHLCI